ncbi:MAG: hypothetical protein KDA75_13030 [Planctomycetaceae bacterium]|nr:hypothetical protein [Planctomycetaceae bacterium]
MKLLIAALTLVSGLASMTTANDASAQPAQEQVAAVLNTLQADGTFQACLAVERDRAPLEAVRLYHAVAAAAYSDRKDVRGTIALSRAGIQLGLTTAEQVAATDPMQAEELRGAAKAIAYNLGANLWPGWEDEGIELTPSDIATGLEAAQLNLRLAEELNRPPLPRSNAHWLVGAQELARGDCTAAEHQFDLARRQSEAAENPAYVLSSRGYMAVARLKQRPGDAAASAEFDEAVGGLKQLDTDDSRFFADQLVSVRSFFVNNAAGKP